MPQQMLGLAVNFFYPVQPAFTTANSVEVK